MTGPAAGRGSKLVALGGVGGDAHTVGLFILGASLARAGFRLRFLGTQNSLPQICAAARGADAVLISNMDGHAAYYLHDLPSVKAAADADGAVWYLGGNPTVDDGDAAAVAALKRLGFSRVFGGYVEAGTVIALLDGDLGTAAGPGGESAPVPLTAPRPAGGGAPRPVPFRAEREEVLAQWATGAQARAMADSAGWLYGRATLAQAQRTADRAGRVLVHPRCGVASASEQQEIFHLLREAGADVLSFQIDSLTRNNAYAEVERIAKEADAHRRRPPPLNGFPAVNHGVAALRGITGQFRDVPLQVRHSTRDPRLIAEISFAAGITAFEGGPVSYNMPYYRDYPPAEAIARWRYVDNLTAEYWRRFSVVIDREFFGVLTATLVPPCAAIAVDVLEALLAARAGVRSVSLGYAEQGHRAQDMAAIAVLRRAARTYLDAYGYRDTSVHTVFHQYMGAFPGDPEKAGELIRGSAATAGLCRPTRIMVKTRTEASRIPSAADNAAAIAQVRGALEPAAGEGMPARGSLAAEEEILEAEVTAILDAVLASDREDLAAAVATGISQGLIDIPFSPSLWNSGLAVTVRDEAGAVRFADPGRIPLPAAVRDWHRTRVESRLRRCGHTAEQAAEHDVLRIARGEFDAWPLG